MKKTIRFFLVTLLMLLGLSNLSLAQQGVISGKITGIDDSQGIVGASVMVKGTKKIVVSGDGGSFRINATKGQTLEVSFISYVTQEVVIGDEAVLNVVLVPDATTLMDAVVIGYGTQKRANLTGAVSTIDVQKTLDSRPITDVGRGLQGTSPGLTVYSTSGQIGVPPNIKIRGLTGSLNGSSNPLILVDNVEVPNLNYVNPEDIESISTLKDAATTAIYGARAAFGAILITTKKGSKDGKTKFTYSNNFAFSTPTKKPMQTRADLNLDYSYQQLKALGSSSTEFGYTGFYYNLETIRRVKEYIDLYGSGEQFGREMVEGRDFDYKSNGGAYFYRPWNVDDLYYKKWTPQQTHNVAVSGGAEKFNYNMSLGYVNQKGVMKLFDDAYKRYNMDIFISSKVTSWLTVRGKSSLTRTQSQLNPFSFTGSTHVAMMYFYRWHPTYPYGTYHGNEFRTPYGEMKAGKPQDYGYYYNRNTVGTTMKIIEGLTADFDYTYWTSFDTNHTTGGIVSGIDHWNMAAGQTFDDAVKDYYGQGSSYDYVYYNTFRTVRNVYNGFITYDKSVKNHSFKLMTGLNIEDQETVYHYSSRDKMIDYSKGEVNLAYGDQTATSSHGWWSVAGFFGRFNYAFKDKYLFEVNGRYDGSSKFPANDQWAFFPSISAGYRITEEPFMNFAKPWLNSFKIRASYGSVGNQDVGTNQFIPTMAVSTSPWLIGEDNPVYLGVPGLVSPNLTWETVTTLDIGADARILKDKVGITFDWYQRVTSNMLSAGEAVPSTLGTAAPKRNYGELTTTGVELQVDFNHTFENGLIINAMAQFSDYRTKITKFASAGDPSVTANYEGRYVGEIWGYKADRLFQKDDFEYDANGNIVQVTLPNGQVKNKMKDGIATQYVLESGVFRYSPGDVKYADLDGSGAIDFGTNTVGNHGDKTVIGNTQPRFSYGFRVGAAWKGVDFDMFFQGVGSRQVWATGNMVLPGWQGTEANYAHTLDYWTPENPGAFYPRPLNHANAPSVWNYQPSDRYILNLSYLRCKNINIGYTFPKKWMKKIHVTKLRVYASAENLFEIDNMGDIPIDPELDWDTRTANDARYFGRSYPYARTLSFGIQLTF